MHLNSLRQIYTMRYYIICIYKRHTGFVILLDIKFEVILMDNFEILEKWAKFSEYDPNQTSFSFGTISYETRRGNERLADIQANYDLSGTLSVLYAKYMFLDFIKQVKVNLYELLHNPDDYADVKEMWDIFHGEDLIAAEDTLLKEMDHLVSKVIKRPQLGSVDWTAEKEKLFRSISIVIESLNKCHYDAFLKGGDIQSINNVSTNIHVFPTIAQCVLTLEGSPDGMYLCYVNNNGDVTGFFGFYIKSNGSIVSINERIIERYAGQHGNRRNNRFSESKQFELFPYSFIFKFTEHDYKGYASKHIIDNEKLAFFELGSDAYLPILLAMLMITRRFQHKSFEGDQVYIDALMPVNYELSAGTSTALVSIENSQVIAINNIEVPFTSQGIIDNAYGEQFDHSSEVGKSKQYFESGQFKGYNQIFVDTYGQDFKFDPKRVFEMNQHIKQISSGERDTYVDDFGRTKSNNVELNDILIGTKNYMELQSYYQARKQLAEHIEAKMAETFKAFGEDTIKTWYPIALKTNLHTIEDLIMYAEYNNLFVNKSGEPAGYCTIGLDDCTFTLNRENDYTGPSYGSTGVDHSRIMNVKKDKYLSTGFFCNITGSIATVWYIIQPESWKCFERMFGADVPTVLKGWRRNGLDGFKIGNSILDVVDPVSRIITPFEHRGSFTHDRYAYKFSLAIGYSKRGFKQRLKDYIKSKENDDGSTEKVSG